MSLWSIVRIGAYGGQVIDEVLAQVCLTVGPMGPPIHPVVISPVPECIIGIDTVSSYHSPHIGYLTSGVKVIMVRKVKWEPLELLPPKKRVNQKQYLISKGITDISVTIKNMKRAGLVIPTTSAFI